MTPNAIRIAMAELGGWTKEPDADMWRNPHGIRVGAHHFPNYPCDLNAVARFEEGLTDLEWVHYLRELSRIVRKPKQAELQIKQYMLATALQHCEAILRVKGRWVG